MGEKREGGNGSGCREENGEGWSREGKGVRGAREESGGGGDIAAGQGHGAV